MNSEMKEMQVAHFLEQCSKSKQPYIQPDIKVHPFEQEFNLLAASPHVSPSVPNFQEDDWNSYEQPIWGSEINESE